MASREVSISVKATDSFSPTLDRYKAKMGEAAQATNKVGDSTGALESGFRRMQQAFDLGIAGGMINKLIDTAEGMNRVGQAVNDNRRLFAALTDDIGGQADVLERLRGATGGVVTDLDLMAGANQSLRLNIASNADELENLLGVVTKLKSPTESLGDALSNFNLMISNESYLRLDSLGISSAEVKRRVDELGESFRDATLAVAGDNIKKLGDAANNAITPLGRLQTDVANFWNGASANFNIGLQATVGFMQAIGDYEGRQAAAQQAVADEAYARGSVIGEAYQQGFTDAIDPQAATEFISKLLGQIQQGITPDISNPSVLAQLGNLPSTFGADSDVFIQLNKLGQFVLQQNQMMEDAARINQHNKDIESQRLSIAREEYSFRQHEVQLGEQRTAQLERQANLDPLENTYQQLSTMLHEGGLDNWMVNGVTLFTDEDVQRADNMVEQFNVFFDRAEDMHDHELISDEEWNRIKDSAGQVKEMANDIQRGADAMQNLSLSGLFGQTGGGMLGEVTDQLLARAQESGMSADDIAKLKDSLDLRSGRQTGFSQSFSGIEDLILSLPTDQAAEAAQRWVQVMQGAVGAGISPEFMMNNQMQALGIGGGGSRSIHINSGQGIDEILGQYPGLTRDQLMGAAGTGNGRFILPGDFDVNTSQLMGNFDPETIVDMWARVNEQTDTAKTDVEGINNSTLQMGDNLGNVGKILGDIFDKKYVLKLDAVAPEWLKALLSGVGGDAFGKAMADATRANGGIPPGTQPQRDNQRLIQW